MPQEEDEYELPDIQKASAAKQTNPDSISPPKEEYVTVEEYA